MGARVGCPTPARYTAAMAFNEPPCRQLKHTRGVLKEVDTSRMRTESDSRRADYYQKRLADSVLDLRPDLTSSVVATVMAERPAGRYHLVKLCRKQIEKHGLDNAPISRRLPASSHRRWSNGACWQSPLAITTTRPSHQ